MILSLPDSPNDPAADWREFEIPGSDRPVRMWRLHAQAATRESLAVVRFPAGWARPAAGHYACAEEFLVLDGSLSVSGTTSGAGDYAYLPPRALREDSHTAAGCVALAYFSDVPRWSPGPPVVPADHDPRSGVPEGLLRGPRPDVPGRCEVLPAVPQGPVDADTDLVSLPTGQWTWCARGATPASIPGPVLVRTWAAIPDSEE